MRTRPSDIKPSRLSIALFAALALPVAGTTFAQDAAEQEQEPEQATEVAEQPSAETTQLDRVVVTGSRIKRAEIEGPAPVTVITRADMDREGFVTVADALQSMTQNTTFGFSGDMVTSGFTPNAQIINLRSLGPGYTLILVDGRRLAEYPQPYNSTGNFVNASSIPSSIVERIEILTGGASAIYGSDAVAGVVNVITRKHYEGDTIQITGGTTSMGGGDTAKIQFGGGKSGADWDVVYGAEYFAQEAIFGTQRDFIDSNLDSPLAPNVSPSLSLIAIGLLAADGGRSVYYPGEETCNNFGFETYNSPTRGLICGARNVDALDTVQNKQESLSAYLRGSKNIGNMQIWGSVMGWDSKAISSSGVEFWGTSGNRYSGSAILIPALNPATAVDLGGGNLYNLVQLQRIFTPAEIGGPAAASTQYDESAFQFAAGIGGTVFNDRFDWDVTLSHSTYDYKTNRPRLLAEKVHEYFLGSTTPLGVVSGYPIFNLNVDRFFHQPITPDIYRSLTTRVINEGDSSASQATFSLTGDLFELPAGPVGMASVLEWARQEYDLNADPRILPSYTGPEYIYNLTGTGGGGERDRYAAGVEFSVPIFETLKAQLAARYDKYDDVTNVDDATTYNLGLEWRPFTSLLVRGSYATSFRAPDMHQVFAEQSGSFSTLLDEYACRSGTGVAANLGPRTYQQCNTSGDPTIYSSFGIREGNRGLEEEEGKSWTAGFVWDIVDNMALSIDYYSIELENQVGDISNAYILQNEANCRLGVRRDGSPFEFDMNSAFCQEIIARISRMSAPGTTLDTRVDEIVRGPRNRAYLSSKGIDANWRYRLDTDRLGEFGFQLAYTHTLESRYAEFEEDPRLDYRDDLNNYEHRSKVRGAVNWNMGDWSATVYGSRWGSTPNWAETGRLGPYMTYNLSVGKKVTDDLKVTFLVNNVLNNTHKEDPTHTSWPYFNPYLYTPVGRQLYLQLDYRFN